jgi:hypothetical protein
VLIYARAGNRSHLYGGKDTDVTCFHVQSKVVVIPGDLHKPNLGLSEEDEARIVNEVQFVVHSAASISFFEHIHTLLEQNYEVGLRALCTDCGTMETCKACVAVEVADCLSHTVSMHITVLQCACLSAYFVLLAHPAAKQRMRLHADCGEGW